MADIDDDLLDLAGGDSGDDGSDNESRDRSESPPPAKKKDARRAPAKKAKRRGKGDDSEEEGEASSQPGTPNSLESAPMDESDSDEEPSRAPAADGDEMYPVDGMYVSHAEKAEIMAMPELDREQILSDRAAEVDRQRQNRLLRQMVEIEERKQKKKRTADTAELDDASRKTSRQRTVKTTETAMDTLRRKKLEKQRRRDDLDNRREAGSSPQRDYNDRHDSEDDFGRAESRTPEPDQPRDEPPAELRDYERVRLGRNEFAQVCYTPGFNAGITGCFIRIAIGPHPETGIEQYRMAAIKGFATGRAYAMQGPSGQFVTDQYVKAGHGKAVREFPFIAASSGKFTESELNRYVVTCQNEGIPVPTKASLMNKVDDINNLLRYNWTNEEIKAQLARKKEIMRRFDPSERERVSRLLEEAREKGDDQKVEELQEKLDQLGNQRLAFRTSLAPTKNPQAQKETEQDRLAERNRENRRLNKEAVRKAQLKEKAKAREIEMAIKRGEHVQEDSSRRVRTKAKFVHDINEQVEKKPANGSGTSTPINGTPNKAATAKQAILPHLAKLQEEKHNAAKGVPSIHKPLMDDDVIGALDLDIDVDI